MEENRITVEIEKSIRNTLTPEDYRSIGLSAEERTRISGKDVIIRGRMPMACYMRFAVEALACSPRSICVRQPQSLEAFRVYPPANEGVSSDPDVARHESIRHGDALFLRWRKPSRTLLQEDMPAFAECVPKASDITDVSEIVFSGPLPNWIYTLFAVVARRQGWRKIAYCSPRERYVLRIFPQLEPTKTDTPYEGHDGVVIGIVGDPHSGKSVFSGLLYEGACASEHDVWIADCDYSSPTPPWYAETIRRKGLDVANDFREKIKRDGWTPGAEEELAAQITLERRRLDWLVADLPGGKGKGVRTRERIPERRDVLLKAIDRFIVLAKKIDGEDTGLLWRDALAKHGLEERIALTVYSTDFEARPEILFGEDGILKVAGLDREKAHLFTLEQKNLLWQAVKKVIVNKNLDKTL